MKKIGEATFLIVAEEFLSVQFPFRSLRFFCSRPIVNEEQSSLDEELLQE